MRSVFFFRLGLGWELAYIVATSVSLVPEPFEPPAVSWDRKDARPGVGVSAWVSRGAERLGGGGHVLGRGPALEQVGHGRLEPPNRRRPEMVHRRPVEPRHTDAGEWPSAVLKDTFTYQATSSSTFGLFVPFHTTVRVLLSVVVVTYTHPRVQFVRVYHDGGTHESKEHGLVAFVADDSGVTRIVGSPVYVVGCACAVGSGGRDRDRHAIKLE